MNTPLVIIPALKKHAVIPDQLVKRMAGKTLIQRALDTALSAFPAGWILVVTDSQEISLIAERNGVRFHYDAGLRFTSLDIVAGLQDILLKETHAHDPLLIYRASCPLLGPQDLIHALARFRDSGADCMISVRHVRQRIWEARSGTLSAVLTDEDAENGAEMLVESKALVVLRAAALHHAHGSKNLRVAPYFLNDRAVEINSYQDWWICERLLARRHVVFVVAGYPAIGMGHVYRGLMLAHEIAHHKISFLCTAASELAASSIAARDYHTHMQRSPDLAADVLALRPDLVVNDILDTDAPYMTALKQAGLPVVNFEDKGPGAARADLVVNALYESTGDPRVLAGPECFCLRDEFISAKRNAFRDTPKCVLVTFGGTDMQDFTRQTLDAIEPLCRARGVAVRVVTGPGYAHREALEAHLARLANPQLEFTCATNAMSRMMEGVDMAIVSAGRTVYELAHMRIPSLVLAQHQREALHTFARSANGFLYLGVMQPTFRSGRLRRAFTTLLDNPALRERLYLRQARIDFTANKARVVRRMLRFLKESPAADSVVANGACNALHQPLITERLVLRQWRQADKIPFAALNANPKVMKYFPALLSREASDASVDRYMALIARQGWGLWAVERRTDGIFMGFVGLHRPENMPFSPCLEVGWRLDRPFWGHGYATEAARACLNFAFTVVQEKSVVAYTAVSNTPSQAVMRRLGMKQECCFENPEVPEGHHLRKHVLFRINAADTTAARTERE